MSVTVINKNKRPIKVISPSEQDKHISSEDAEMDARAVAAVKAAVEKAKLCKKPVAKYDPVLKKAYLEYANGEVKYVK